MGILGLTKLLGDMAPSALREKSIDNYFSRTVAIDASMCAYSFLIAVRQMGPDGPQMLTNEAGEVTSHLQGFFSRTIRIMDKGLKPVFVFDGKPPELKKAEIAKRKKEKEKSAEELKEAQKSGDLEAVEKLSKRTVRVTREQNEESKRLLRLMGVPVVEAPTEAEAQCAELCKGGVVFGVGSEDMDTLTFGSPRLLRHVTESEAKKVPVLEINLADALHELGMTMDQFIDMCILAGCDYVPKIRGIGPKKAYTLIKEHKNIETVLEKIDKTKYIVPEEYLYKEARAFFQQPDVTPHAELKDAIKWGDCDEAGLVKFLCEEKGFNEDRVRRSVARLRGTKRKADQKRLDSWFTVTTVKRAKKDPKADKKKKKKGGGRRRR